MTHGDLTEKLVKLLKSKGSRTADIPTVLIEAVVEAALDHLLDVFDDEEGQTPEWLPDPRLVTLGDLVDNAEDWRLCEDGSLWPEFLTDDDGEGVYMPKEDWKDVRDEAERKAGD
jgi:hypothetical protein